MLKPGQRLRVFNPGSFFRYVAKYTAGLAAVGLSLAFRVALAGAAGPDLPTFLVFCPAVVVVAFLAGMGPGVLTTAASTVVVAWKIFQPQPTIWSLSPAQWVGLFLFLITGFLLCTFAAIYKRALHRTASRKFESDLEQSEARFSAMFHASPVSMSLVRLADGTCYDANRSHVELFGYSREETIGHTAAELNVWVNPGDREEVLEMLSRDDEIRGYEADIRRRDGETRTVLLSADVINLGSERLAWMLHNDISKRKRAEEMLRVSEEKFSLAFANNPAAIALSRLHDGMFVEVNDTWTKLTGFSRDEAIGRSARSIGVWPNVDDARRFVEALDSNGLLHGWEQTFFKKSGEPFVAQLSAQLISIAGEVVILSTLIDITQRKTAERALRTLIDVIPGLVLLVDENGAVMACNEPMATALGTTAREIIGRVSFDLLDPATAESRRRHFNECISTGLAVRFEDFRYGRHLDNYMSPIRDASGRVSSVAVFALDITERKNAEERTREQAALLDIASDAILVKDLENRIRYWNKGAERLYGWSASEVIGKSTFDLLYPPEWVEEGKRARSESLELGEWQGDLHQRHRDGKDILVEARWTLIRDEAGEATAILSVKSDVTAKRQVESQLLRSQRLESLGTLAGGIAHDLNNVLSPILVGVELLFLEEPNESARNTLSIIKTSARRGANIVRQILNFARGTEGKMGEIQLKHVLREVEDILGETLPKSISVDSSIPRELWPVRGDATQLQQVVMNLCVNARDAMADGGQIRLVAENIQLDEAYATMHVDAKPARYVVVSVEDTGIGIPPNILERIFDPFFTTKEPGKGTGLGLATVRSIVKAHGGFVNVYSEAKRGASFKVYIPAMAPEENAAAELERIATPRGSGELILVVDDEAELREVTGGILRSYGYRVVEAADGTEAIARFIERKTEVRAVIMDMMMPYMNGAATIRAIRNVEPNSRFIATSGLTSGEYSAEAKRLEVGTFLPKPYTAEQLLEALHDLLANE